MQRFEYVAAVLPDPCNVESPSLPRSRSPQVADPHLQQFFEGVTGVPQVRIIDFEESTVVIRDIESVRVRLDQSSILHFTVA